MNFQNINNIEELKEIIKKQNNEIYDLRLRISKLEDELFAQKKKLKTCSVYNCDQECDGYSAYCEDHVCYKCNNLRNNVGQYCDDCACKSCREKGISYNYSYRSKYCVSCGCKCGYHVDECRCYS